jgi:hypothetical protein
MRQPIVRPRIMDADFISGEPNCSTMMTVTKTEKPRPMSFGSPLYQVSSLFPTMLNMGVGGGTYQTRGFGAPVLGHKA